MGKTFLVGFIGLVLVGGLVTGLYLINQPTNPSSSASSGQEVVVPIVPPTEAEVSVTPPEDDTPILSVCEKAFGTKTGDVDFIVRCDLDKNGIINVLDLSKMK